MLQGHIDGIGRVLGVETEGNAVVVTIESPASVSRLSVDQGSVAVDGVSLTIVDVSEERLRVALIPHTATVTTLGRLRRGAEVNMEADLIAKYVHAFLERRKPAPGLDVGEASRSGVPMSDTVDTGGTTIEAPWPAADDGDAQDAAAAQSFATVEEAIERHPRAGGWSSSATTRTARTRATSRWRPSSPRPRRSTSWPRTARGLSAWR